MVVKSWYVWVSALFSEKALAIKAGSQHREVKHPGVAAMYTALQVNYAQ